MKKVFTLIKVIICIAFGALIAFLVRVITLELSEMNNAL
jgi:hypothetical protein